MVRKINARNKSRSVDGIDRKRRGVAHRGFCSTDQQPITESSNHRDEVSCRRVKSTQYTDRKDLAVRRVQETTDHLQTKHRSHMNVLLAQRLSMDRAAHAGRAKVRRLLQTERDQFHSKRRWLPRKQSRQLYQSSDTACVVVGTRQWTRCIVVCANDDSLF